jgi:hypothetical protein
MRREDVCILEGLESELQVSDRLIHHSMWFLLTFHQKTDDWALSSITDRRLFFSKNSCFAKLILLSQKCTGNGEA